MTKRDDPKLIWVCEDCGTVHAPTRDADGTQPPDECKRCAFTYFENLYDLQQEANKLARAEGVTLH